MSLPNHGEIHRFRFGGTSRLAATVLVAGLTVSAVPADIVINELHIDEADKTVLAEFIELVNTSPDPVDLSGWAFTEGVSFTFPPGSVIGGNGYLVVAQNPATVQAEFGHAGALGPWEGKLSNDGETLTLRNASGTQIDEVDYQLGFPWPTYGDPPSPSIELIHPALDNDLGGSWRSAGNTLAVTVTPAVYVPRESTWSYHKGTSFPAADGSGLGWTENGYDEGAAGGWLNGPAPVGYGDGDDATVLNDMQGGYNTFFMRREFTVVPGQVPAGLALELNYDDAAVVWINGVEVFRTPGMTAQDPLPFPPPNAPNHEAGSYEEFTLTNALSYLVEDTNTVAVQLVNQSITSSDATLDISLATPGANGSGFVPADPTPGARNTVYSTAAAPQMRQVDHEPAQPTGSDDVTVTIKVTDPQGVAAVVLAYQTVAPGDYIAIDDPRYQSSWTDLPMADDGTAGDAVAGDSVLSAVIPASAHGHRHLVRYRITASDAGGAGVTAPYRDDPQPNFAFFAYDNFPAYTARATPGSPLVTYDFDAMPTLQQNVPVYHLVTTREAHEESQYIPDSSAGTYGGSDYLWEGALVYGGRVYDHIRFRARGGVWRYAMGKNMWKFDFNRGHRFDAQDEFGRGYSVPWDKLNLSALIQQGNFGQRGEQGIFEGAGFRIHNLASNPAPNTHYVHFRIVESADENGAPGNQFDTDFQGLYMAIEQLDGQFLDEHGLPDGNLYKMEGGTGELNNQGPTQPTNKADLNTFLSAIDGGAASQAYLEENLWLDDYYNFYAAVTAIQDNDIHANKNYFFYHRPADPLDPHGDQWQVINWDLDLTWTTTYRQGAPDDRLDQDVFAHADLARAYRNRMREIRDLLFNPEQTGMVIDEVVQFVHTPGQPSYVDADRAMWDYNPILVSSYVNSSKAGHGRFYEATGPRTFAAMINHVKAYVASRGTYIDSTVLTDDGQVPNTPLLSYTGAPGFPADGIAVTSSGFSSPVGAGFASMEFRAAEVTDVTSPLFDPAQPRQYEIEADWESGELSSFTASQTVPAAVFREGQTYRLRVRHEDTTGRWSHWSAPVEFVATGPDPSDYLANLMITELMFNPPQPTGDELALSTNNDDFEFIELTNVGTDPLDLTNVRFTKGVDFDFAPNTELAGGARVLVVKNVAAFEARYGTGLPVGGSYGGDNLANGGERLKLSLGAGTAIRDFVYDDEIPWPTDADGGGYSLVLIDPPSAPNHALPENWRLSRQPGGNPGSDDTLDYATWQAAHSAGEPAEDDDGDGIANGFEFKFGTDPQEPDGHPGADVELAVLEVGGVADVYLTVSVRSQIGTDAFNAMPEFSGDLATWTGGAVLVSSAADGNGFVNEVWRSPAPVSSVPRHYVRLRLSE